LIVSIQCQSNGLIFFEGFALGIEAEIGNPKECAKSANMTLTDFDNGYSEIKNGIWDLSIEEVKQGLLDWSLGLQQMTNGLKECGAMQLAADIEKLALDIQSGEGILKLLASEVLNIIENNIAGLFDSAVNAWSRGDYYNTGIYTGQIVGLLLQDNVTKKAIEFEKFSSNDIVLETVRNEVDPVEQREKFRAHEYERAHEHSRKLEEKMKEHHRKKKEHAKKLKLEGDDHMEDENDSHKEESDSKDNDPNLNLRERKIRPRLRQQRNQKPKSKH